MQSLNKRITHKYNSAYSHLDEWEEVGEFYVVTVGEKLYSYNEEDFCDTFSRYIVVEVKSDISEKEVIQVLKDKYSFSDCTHEWDCCGCYSYFVLGVYPLDENRYCIKQTGGRNY